jgi:uncharacterized membrane protein YGL010W
MTAETTLDEWADRYGALRASGPGSVSALLAIALGVSGLIGLLWSAPVPASLSAASPAINIATLFLIATFVYYCILSISVGLAGFVFLLLATVPSVWIARQGLPLAAIAGTVFAISFIWHLFDTFRATGRPGVIGNLQLLMLGPVWLIRAAYRNLGLAY